MSLGELGGRDRSLQAAARTHTTMVVDDRVEVAAQIVEEPGVPVGEVPLIPMIISSGGPEPARS